MRDALVGVAAAVAVTFVTARASAQAIDPAAGDPWSLGRAGVSVVSGDGQAALEENPAGIMRRSESRAQAGVTFVDRSARYDSELDFGAGAVPPTVRDRGGADALPSLGLELGLGDRVVAGVAFLWPTHVSYAVPTAPDGVAPTLDQRHEYPHRYAASRFTLDRRGVALGAAVRALPWLAVGASLVASDVVLNEDRTVWAGQPGELLYDPDFDMHLSLRTRDHFVPAGALGVLVAPVDVPLEMAASVFLSDKARTTGEVALQDSRGVDPQSGDPYATADVTADAAARTEIPIPTVVRVGVRFLQPRFTLEAQGELALLTTTRPVFDLDGVAVLRPGNASRPVTSVASATALRSTFSVGAAADLDLVPGFLTLLAGYSFSRGAVPPSDLSTALPSLDAHTIGAGLEARAGDATVTLGVSRTLGLATEVAPADSAVTLLAPFYDQHPPIAGGTYDSASTRVALQIEITR